MAKLMEERMLWEDEKPIKTLTTLQMISMLKERYFSSYLIEQRSQKEQPPPSVVFWLEHIMRKAVGYLRDMRILDMSGQGIWIHGSIKPLHFKPVCLASDCAKSGIAIKMWSCRCASHEAVVATMDLWYMGKSCGTPGANNSMGNEARKRFDKDDAVYSQIRDKYLSLRKSTRTEIASAIEELHDKLFEFVTDSDRKHLIAKLQETKDWLYEDGEDETKGLYVAKLDELKKVLHLEENVEQQKE
ncbi:heat shock 70 kDa protein 15-like protein [Tanacetum coccineum]